MLLMPQHFQQLAGRYEGLVQYAASVGGSFPWGLIRFDYDRTALVSGILRVLRVEAVMRDGFFVEAGADAGIPLDLNLKNSLDQMRSGYLMVHLAVPAQRALSSRGDLARYESHDGDAVSDDVTGEEPVHIPRLRPRISLWAGEDPPARFQSLPLLRIQVNNDTFEEFEFIPPMVTVPTDSALGTLCAELIGHIRTKAWVLADHLRGGSSELGDADIPEIRYKAQGLAVGLPMPEAALHSGRVHPFSLYLLMCQLAGYVSTVTSGLVCPQFPPYRHEDLLNTFQPVLEHIRAAVAEAVMDSWTALPFRRAQGRFEAGPSLALDRVIGSGTLDQPVAALALRVPPDATEEAVRRWAEESVIGSAGLMTSLLASRVPGALRRRTERLLGLAPPRGMVLLSLVLDSETAHAGEALQIVERFDSAGRPSDAVLYVQRSANADSGE
jgi:type VI secretion system protein ImpJ